MTDGPWEYRDDKHGIYVCSLSPKAPQYGGEDRPVDLLSDGETDDLKLMAEAPALLAALREVIAEVDYQKSKGKPFVFSVVAYDRAASVLERLAANKH